MVGSPGPASLILLYVGANQSFKKSFLFLIGVVISKQFIIWPLGFGLQSIFSLSQYMKSIFFIFAIFYFIFLIYKFSLSNFSNKFKKIGKVSFLYGLAIHPINPKAWIMVTAVFSSFSNPDMTYFENTLFLAIIFFIIQLVFHSIWCFAGSAANKLISNTKYERPFFISLSLFTFLSLVFLIY